jgi:hypothetical protein
MNWYKITKLSALDPEAWQLYDQTSHRLDVDKPFTVIPRIGPTGKLENFKLPQPQKSQQELGERYKGVHATKSKEIAALYANNFATKEDPPVILEFATYQHFYTDIDADLSHNMDNVIESIKYDLKDVWKKWVSRIRKGFSRLSVRRMMNEIKDLDNYMDQGEQPEDLYEVISQQNQSLNPSEIVNYFDYYYESKAEQEFYNKFLLPVFLEQGYLDPNIQSWLINQMRFMEPIPESQIVGIYTFELFAHDFSDVDYEEQSDYDESGRMIMSRFDDYDIPFTTIWQDKQMGLIPLETYYHGTTLSRAKAALPQLANVLEGVRKNELV